MADSISSIISAYRQRLIAMPCVPATSYGRATLGEEEVPNKLLYTFCGKNVGIQFLEDVELLRSSMLCSVCVCVCVLLPGVLVR